MKYVIVLLASLTFPFSVSASIDVKEGGDVKENYESNKGQITAIIQKRKAFYLQEPSKEKLQRKPEELRVKAGEIIYIVNSEKEITHNIYDESDNTWVLTAQAPGDIATVVFNDKGTHDLKCAIHPKMKIKLIVE